MNVFNFIEDQLLIPKEKGENEYIATYDRDEYDLYIDYLLESEMIENDR